MFGFNFLQLSFLIITFLVTFLGYLIFYFEQYLPAFISQIYRYGKISYRGSSKFYSLRVPKSWFQHFYIFSSIWSSVILICVFSLYIYKIPLHSKILDFLDLLGGKDRTSNISATTTLISVCLLTMQSYKRFYETQFVNVFSNSYMDIGHYFLGLYHYFGAVSATVLESPGFTRSRGGFDLNIKPNQVGFLNISAIIVFLYAWWKQLESAKILSNLRKNKDGKVISQKHLIPKGGLFNKVSSPHLTCEILMYICLTIILYGNTTFPYITLWVVSNQVSVALFNHKWYKSEFKDYPKERKALIPGIF